MQGTICSRPNSQFCAMTLIDWGCVICWFFIVKKTSDGFTVRQHSELFGQLRSSSWEANGWIELKPFFSVKFGFIYYNGILLYSISVVQLHVVKKKLETCHLQVILWFKKRGDWITIERLKDDKVFSSFFSHFYCKVDLYVFSVVTD